VGRVFYRDRGGSPRSRYFVVAAGVGADAFFFSRLDSRLKQRLGYTHYLIEALRLWATHTFPIFAASFVESGSPTPQAEEISQLLAVRISNFGGLVRNLVPGAAIQQRKSKSNRIQNAQPSALPAIHGSRMVQTPYLLEYD